MNVTYTARCRVDSDSMSQLPDYEVNILSVCGHLLQIFLSESLQTLFCFGPGTCGDGETLDREVQKQGISHDGQWIWLHRGHVCVSET